MTLAWVEKEDFAPPTGGGTSGADDATYGNGIGLFTWGTQYQIITTDNGETWTRSNASISAAPIATNLAYGDYGGGTFVGVNALQAVAGNQQAASRSTDGVSWAISSSGMSNAGYTTKQWFPAYDSTNDLFMAVTNYDEAQDVGLVYARRSSSGGASWSDISLAILTDRMRWTGNAWGNGTWVIITDRATDHGGSAKEQVRTSTDLLSFTERTAGAVNDWID